MCERDIVLLPTLTPQLGTRPTTQACTLTRNQISNLLLCQMMLNQLSHTGQGFRLGFDEPQVT